MGLLDSYMPSDRPVRVEAARGMLIVFLEQLAERAGTEVAQDAERAISSLRAGAAFVSVDGCEYVVKD